MTTATTGGPPTLRLIAQLLILWYACSVRSRAHAGAHMHASLQSGQIPSIIDSAIIIVLLHACQPGCRRGRTQLGMLAVSGPHQQEDRILYGIVGLYCRTVKKTGKQTASQADRQHSEQACR